jgi:gentisate 1,2-dioxygenase
MLTLALLLYVLMQAASCEMRFSAWSNLLSHYRRLNAHLPKWMTQQFIYTKGSSAIWFQRLKLDLYQQLNALAATTYARLLCKQQQCNVKADHKTGSSAVRLHTAVVTKSTRPFAKYLATAQQQQLDTITALLQCFSCCCETLIGVHSVSVQSGMNTISAEFQGLDIFELLQK